MKCIVPDRFCERVCFEIDLLLLKLYSIYFSSQDDPFFITAAIVSGPNTDIVSKDLFRGHKFLLKDKMLKQIFQRWQWQHQWMVFLKGKRPAIQVI